jgi:hypothetical protein
LCFTARRNDDGGQRIGRFHRVRQLVADGSVYGVRRAVGEDQRDRLLDVESETRRQTARCAELRCRRDGARIAPGEDGEQRKIEDPDKPSGGKKQRQQPERRAENEQPDQSQCR